MQMVSVVLFVVVGILAPFVLSPDRESMASGGATHNLMIYAAYGAYLVYSIVLELYVICSIRGQMRVDEEPVTNAK